MGKNGIEKRCSKIPFFRRWRLDGNDLTISDRAFNLSVNIKNEKQRP
jgi:hypothetical protein